MINLQNYFPFWFSFLLKSHSVPMVGVVVKPSVELCRCMQEKESRGENVYGCLEWLASQEWLLRRLFLGKWLLHRLR